VVVDVDASKVTLSKVFDWYSKDFGPTQMDVLRSGIAVPSVEMKPILLSCVGVRWILPRLSEPKQGDLRALLEGSPTIEFAPYDWSTNGVTDTVRD
jgi:hypothetical protein